MGGPRARLLAAFLLTTLATSSLVSGSESEEEDHCSLGKGLSLPGCSSSDSEAEPESLRCRDMLGSFHQAHFRLNACTDILGKPYNFCKSCRKEYIELKRIRDKFEKDECAKHGYDVTIFEGNKISYSDVVKRKSEWEKGHCDLCYDDLESGKLSEKAKRFLEMDEAAQNCFLEVRSGLAEEEREKEYAPLTHPICIECRTVYKALRHHYDENIYRRSEYGTVDRRICRDLSDSINRTSTFWSYTMQCHQRVRDRFGPVWSFFALWVPAFCVAGLLFQLFCWDELMQWFYQDVTTHDDLVMKPTYDDSKVKDPKLTKAAIKAKNRGDDRLVKERMAAKKKRN